MPASLKKAGKRLIVACDGTWVSSDNGFVRDSWLPWNKGGRLATPSNVTRICRALLPRSTDGQEIPQITFYQGGLGSQNSWWSFFIGGYLGAGIDENMREAYAFICNNYEPGDEIFLIGFSRGAFTARSIGGLIASIGLLTKDGLRAFYPIFRDWENQATDGYTSAYDSPVWPLAARPAFSDPAYLRGLIDRDLTRPNIPIKAIAVWDTVGALGVPNIKLLGWPLYTSKNREYSFVDTRVAPNVENAYQALALDELRDPFSPTIWEAPQPESGATALKELRQCWFPGVHTSVGGGHQDTSISDITLAWLMTRLGKHLSFNPEYVKGLKEANVQFYESSNPSVKVHPWGTGLIKRSDAGIVGDLTGRSVRTPGEYCVTDPKTGLPKGRKLKGTNETIHPSVRYRIEMEGPGLAKKEGVYSGEGVYQPKALQGWNHIRAGEEMEIKGTDEWEGVNGDGGRWYVERADKSLTVLPEEQIEEGTPEWVLLHAWDKVAEELAKNA